MRDMPAIEELDDLHGARERVAQLEKALAAARTKPHARSATNAHDKENLLAINRFEKDLGWARRRLEMLEAPAPASDLDRAKVLVQTLEGNLEKATSKHYAAFPPGVTSDKERASWAEVQKIKFGLDQATWRLEHVTRATERQRVVEAKEANEGVPKNRLFEVQTPDGRVLRHRAHSAAQLIGELEYVCDCHGSFRRGARRQGRRCGVDRSEGPVVLRRIRRRVWPRAVEVAVGNGVTVKRT